MDKPEQDRLDEIKLALAAVDDRVGPDSSLRWLIGEVDRLRANQVVLDGELRVLQALIERIVVRVSEVMKLNPVTTDPYDLVDSLAGKIATLRLDNASLIQQNQAHYAMLHSHLGYSESHRPHLGQLIELVIHQHRGCGSELAEIHDLAAEALGYQRAPSLEEDPNCPCPGQFITGEHTAQTLVMELVKKYQELQTKSYGQGQ